MKPLKILMTNLFLQGHTGSESYLVTLASELRNLGHSVTLYCHNWGWYGDQVKEEGFECWYNAGNKADYKLPHTNFDFVHFQHNETVRRIYSQVKHIPKVFISHGMLPAPEQPVPYAECPMDGYLGVSEETLRNVLEKSKPAGTCYQGIIRNLIDTSRYNTLFPNSKELKNVLIISNYMQRKPEYVDMIRRACHSKGLQLEIIGDAGKRVPDTRPYIRAADLVIGLGRCAFEAMAMKRNILVFDYQGFEGLIKNKDDYLEFRQNNLSGRYRNHTDVTMKEVLEAFEQYNLKYGEKNRQFILDNHDSKLVAKHYEKTMKIIINLCKNTNGCV